MIAADINKPQNNKKEIDIAEAWQFFFNNKENEKAKENIILYYLPLVNYTVQRMFAISFPNIKKNNLTKAGIHGLIEALNDYTPYWEKFDTHAISYIQKAVIRELKSEHLISFQEEKLRLLEETYSTLTKALDHFPTDEELAKFLNINLTQVEHLQKTAMPTSLLDWKIIKEKYSDKLQKKNATDLENNKFKKILKQTLSDFSKQERNIIILYYYKKLTIKEISKVLNITPSKISQIHTKAALKLKLKFKKEKFKD